MDFNINHKEAKAAASPYNRAACHSHSHSLTVLFLSFSDVCPIPCHYILDTLHIILYFEHIV